MAVNNTSASAIPPVSLPIGPTSFSVHNVGVVASATEKITQQIVYQPVVNKPVQVSTTLPIAQPDPINHVKPQCSSAAISAANTVTVAMPPKPAAPKVPQVVTSRPAQPAKTFGSLPINSRSSVSVLPLEISRFPQAATTTTLGDPGGGYLSKTLPGPAAVIQASVKPTKVAAQHVLMAPGLRTPSPSTIKLPTSYPPIYHPLPSYHIHGNISTSNTGLKPSVAFTPASRVQVVRPLAAHNSRTTVSLASSTNADVIRRSSNVVYQPTTTISISVPARTNHQADYVHNQADRTISASAGKPVYQVGIAPLTTSSTSTFAPKVQRMVVGAAPTSFSVIPAISSRNVTSSTSTVVTSVTAFTYSAPTIRLAPITSIATSNNPLPLSKVYPPQATRIHTLQPSVSGISAHVRTTDLHQLTSSSRQPLSIAVTTTQSAAAIPTTVTSLTATRATSQPVMPMMYWPNPLNLNSSGYPTNPSTFQGTAIRPTINVPVTTPSVIGAQIRIPSAVLVMEPPRINTQTSIPSYSQGQVLQSVVASQRGNSGTEHGSLHQTHVATTQPPGASHLTNMSPKPTILRRPARTNEGFPNKKLSFSSEPQTRQIKTSEHSAVDNNTQNSAPAKIRYLSHELYHPSIAGIKPALPGQVPFHKPVTSNGLIQTTKVQVNNTIKDYSTTNYIKLGGDKDQSIHVGRYSQQTIGDVKIKSDPSFQRHSTQIKSETASSHLAQHQYNLSYHQPSNKPHDVSIVSQQPHRTVIHNMPQPANKVRHLQQRGGMLTVATPPNRLASYHVSHGTGSAPNATVLRQIPPNMAQNFRGDNLLHSGVKQDPDLSSAGMKRDYDKMSSPGGQEQRPIKLEPDSSLGFNSHPGHEMVGLSPRKKPRKQTHIIAEDVADQEALDEMSTDDADECEDEPNINTPNPDVKPFELPGKKRVLAPMPPTPPPVTPPTSTPQPLPEKMLKEYTDGEGVRYVHVKERPITLLNGMRLRQVNNHFTHYSDVKVKAEKRTSFHDPCFDSGKLKAWKVPQFAQQLNELVQLDSEALLRIERIKNGLLQFCQTVLPVANGHDASGHMSPGRVMPIPSPSTPCPATTPTSTLTGSFGKPFSPACPGGYSPRTPLEKKAGKFKDEILKIEEMAQANMQRCNVIQEQLAEAKTSMLKIYDHRSFVGNIVTAGRKIQKNSKTTANGSRSAKKKKS